MKNYEITVKPLSAEAMAAGYQPFTQQVEAYVLGAIRDEGEGIVATIKHFRGPDTAWGAFIALVETLMETHPKETAVALEVALDHVKSRNGNGKLH